MRKSNGGTTVTRPFGVAIKRSPFSFDSGWPAIATRSRLIPSFPVLHAATGPASSWPADQAAGPAAKVIDSSGGIHSPHAAVCGAPPLDGVALSRELPQEAKEA